MISAVPRGVQLPPAGARNGARTTRRVKTPASRIASWSSGPPSPVMPDSAAHSQDRLRSLSDSGRSTSPPQWCGASSAATWPRPQVVACAGLRSRSEPLTDTAPRVASHSGHPAPASSNAWASTRFWARPAVSAGCSGCGRSSSASSDSTPSGEVPALMSSRSRSATAPRSASASSSVTIRAPRSSSPAGSSATGFLPGSSAGTTTSHVPSIVAAVPSATGVHTTR